MVTALPLQKFAIGDGNPTNLENVTDLTHKVLEFGLSAAEPKKYMLLTGNITFKKMCRLAFMDMNLEYMPRDQMERKSCMHIDTASLTWTTILRPAQEGLWS